ncbi:MAG: SufE family protein [Bacteroidales bacterium]|nr:SufE family protein [Bacteroidales bacterium]MCF8327717.1 SufE family protein [Bacteroidales bacterium]
MSIQAKQEEIIEEFSMFDDWMDKYNYLIEMGNSLEPLDEQYKTEKYLISGCQSQVWLYAWMEDGKLMIRGDSDAVITKGIVSLLLRVYSGEPPAEVYEDDHSFIDQIGLQEHLSPTRSNGLMSMLKQIKLYALAFKTKQEQKDKNE